MSSRLRGALFFLLGALALAAAPIFSSAGNVLDADELLASDSHLSLFYWIASVLPAIALLALNALLYLSAVALLGQSQVPWLFLPLVLNPFAVLNVLDGYNRYALVFFMFTSAGYLAGRRNTRWPGAVACVVAGFMHPFNFAGALKVLPRFLIALLAVGAFFTTSDFLINVIHTVAPQKSLLLEQFGADLASTYGGNYKLDLPDLPLGVSFVLSRIAAFLFFPMWLMKGASSLDWLLCAYLLVGFAAWAYQSTRHLKGFADLAELLFIVTIVMTFVGNIAVAYRHLGPLLSLFLFPHVTDKGRAPERSIGDSSTSVTVNV